MIFTKQVWISFFVLLFLFTSDNVSFSQTPRSQCIEFDPTIDTIVISCEKASMSDTYAALRNDNLLTKEPNGIWVLKAHLFIDKDSTFTLNSNDTKWLKIYTQFGIKSLGNLVIDSVKVTSWDSHNNTYSNTNGTSPRPYLTQDNEAKGKMNITNSEIGYMGYGHYDRQGITYLGGNGSIFSNNNIHHMWYGFYSSERSNITVTNNTIHDNEIYGIDPHTFTNHMKIRNNTVYNIRNGIGIICSDQCSHILIEDNLVYNTSGPGIMLDLGTNDSVVRNNVEYNSQGAGVSVHDHSSRNSVYNNTLSNNQYGIKISSNATHNQIFKNVISKASDFGICMIEGSNANEIKLNSIHSARNYGICALTGSIGNVIESNQVYNSNICGVYVNNTRLNVNKNNTLVSTDECAPIYIHKYF